MSGLCEDRRRQHPPGTSTAPDIGSRPLSWGMSYLLPLVLSPKHRERDPQSPHHPSLCPPGDRNPKAISFTLAFFVGYVIPTPTLSVKYLTNNVEKIKPQSHHKCKGPFGRKVLAAHCTWIRPPSHLLFRRCNSCATSFFQLESYRALLGISEIGKFKLERDRPAG